VENILKINKISSIKEIKLVFKYITVLSNEFFDYDKVVIATHADDALEILSESTEG